MRGSNVCFKIWILKFWNFGVHFCKMDPMQNRGRRPDTKRPRPVAAGDFFGNLIGPRCLCQNSLACSKRRQCPWCGASVGATGSAPRALACCPWSVMRGLCWNHWFRPLCACVLPDLSRIYSGFIRIRVRSRRSDKNTVKNVYEMETGFMADLCRIYSPFELFQEERPKKRVQ